MLIKKKDFDAYVLKVYEEAKKAPPLTSEEKRLREIEKCNRELAEIAYEQRAIDYNVEQIGTKLERLKCKQ